MYRWPARVGRAYDADVIVDDPFVAPLHVLIEPAGDGRFSVSDLGSVNGIRLSARGERVETATLGPDDLVRVGQSQIRIRAPGHRVADERPMRAVALYRRPLAFTLLAFLTIAVFLWNAWVLTSDDNDRFDMIYPTVAMTIVVAVWIAMWSFISTAVGSRLNFAAHGSVACAGVIALIAVETLFDYVAFAFDVSWADYVGGGATAVLLAYIVFRHLRLNSRAKTRGLAMVAGTISLVMCGMAAGLGLALELSREGGQRYSDAIKPPAFLFVHGQSAEVFLSDVQALKGEVDAMRQTK